MAWSIYFITVRVLTHICLECRLDLGYFWKELQKNIKIFVDELWLRFESKILLELFFLRENALPALVTNKLAKKVYFFGHSRHEWVNLPCMFRSAYFMLKLWLWTRIPAKLSFKGVILWIQHSNIDGNNIIRNIGKKNWIQLCILRSGNLSNAHIPFSFSRCLFFNMMFPQLGYFQGDIPGYIIQCYEVMEISLDIHVKKISTLISDNNSPRV